jgi:UPF0755 protein
VAKARRSRRSTRPRAEPPAPKRRAPSPAWRPRLVAISLGLCAAFAALALVLFGWSFWPGPGRGQLQHFEVIADESESSLVARLEAGGLTASPRLLRAYRRLLSSAPLAVGKHLLPDDLSGRELLRRLARVSGRASVRVVVPEGFNHVQLSQRLEQEGVCDAEEFRRAVRDVSEVHRLGVPGDSAEGYLFPATYQLLADSAPSAVVAVLVQEAERHLRALRVELGAAFEARRAAHGLSEHDVVVLASIIEKEAAKLDEQPVIASVFLNRLADPTFRPPRMLQSDPTASYGCLVLAPPPASCSAGRPTPAMLRDASNPYNTYRHAGLPPGPISSPGESAIRAVLLPARTDYLYFVAQGGGRHRFSRTFLEHREAVEQSP